MAGHSLDKILVWLGTQCLDLPYFTQAAQENLAAVANAASLCFFGFATCLIIDGSLV